MATTNRNKEFLLAIGSEEKAEILKSIAVHYGRTSDVMFAEVTGPDSHHLLDYMVEPMRSKTSALMWAHGMRGW